VFIKIFAEFFILPDALREIVFQLNYLSKQNSAVTVIV